MRQKKFTLVQYRKVSRKERKGEAKTQRIYLICGEPCRIMNSMLKSATQEKLNRILKVDNLKQKTIKLKIFLCR